MFCFIIQFMKTSFALRSLVLSVLFVLLSLSAGEGGRQQRRLKDNSSSQVFFFLLLFLLPLSMLPPLLRCICNKCPPLCLQDGRAIAIRPIEGLLPWKPESTVKRGHIVQKKKKEKKKVQISAFSRHLCLLFLAIPLSLPHALLFSPYTYI